MASERVVIETEGYGFNIEIIVHREGHGRPSSVRDAIVEVAKEASAHFPDATS